VNLSICLFCRQPIASGFGDVGLQLEVHLFDQSRGWPHRHPGTEAVGSRPVLMSHEGNCTARLLEHLAQLEREGLPR